MGLVYNHFYTSNLTLSRNEISCIYIAFFFYEKVKVILGNDYTQKETAIEA